MESKLERVSCRPKTREDASDLYEITKVCHLHNLQVLKSIWVNLKDLKEECEARTLPKELLDEDDELELDEEEEARAMDLLSRYSSLNPT